MELKSIFQMTKTDRYTQDGRDELAKLQETEDVTYKTGDISQKTGLQKQPDGSWAPPKKGGAAPKMGSPEYNKKYGLTKKDVATGKEVDRIYEKQQNRIKELKAKGYTDEQIENDKVYQQTKEDMRNVGKPGAKAGPEKSSAGQKKIDYQVTEKGGKFYATGHQFSDGSQLHAGPFGTEKELHEFMNGSPYKTTESPAAESKPAEKPINYESEVKRMSDTLLELNLERNNKMPPEMRKAIENELSYRKAEGERDLALQKAYAEKKRGESKPTDKYKDLPGAQRKDALYASTFEGISIGQTQNQMERNGWELIQADDDVNVYAKPDGSKVTMKHDGKKITSSEYEAPGSKPAAPSTSEIATSLDEITNPNGGTKNIGGVKVTYVPQNGYRVTHKAPSGKELTTGYDSIEEVQQAVKFRLNRIKNGEIPAISEDSAPRQLTGDCKIRIRK